jgi:hypothetical protein
MLFALIGFVLLLIWVVAFIDVLRRHDLSTSAKVLWALFVLLIPVIGVIAYFVARPPDAHEGVDVAGEAAAAENRLRGQHPA